MTSGVSRSRSLPFSANAGEAQANAISAMQTQEAQSKNCRKVTARHMMMRVPAFAPRGATVAEYRAAFGRKGPLKNFLCFAAMRQNLSPRPPQREYRGSVQPRPHGLESKALPISADSRP